MVYSNFYARVYTARRTIAGALAAVWRWRPSRVYLLIIGLLQIIAWLEAIFIYRHLTGEVLVLHYNVDFGIDLVGAPAHIFIYPVFGLVVLAGNFFLGASFHRHKDFRIFLHLLLSAATLFSLFLNLALMFIYLINFS